MIYGLSKIHSCLLCLQIGDLKITFWGSLATHVSVIAKQRKNSANGEYELVEYLDGKGMDDVNGAVS